VLRDIVLEKGVPLSAYMDRHGSLKRNDKNWTLEEQLAGRQEQRGDDGPRSGKYRG
jgi:hypothetical protein